MLYEVITLEAPDCDVVHGMPPGVVDALFDDVDPCTIEQPVQPGRAVCAFTAVFTGLLDLIQGQYPLAEIAFVDVCSHDDFVDLL